jgi:hypothetical protein
MRVWREVVDGGQCAGRGEHLLSSSSSSSSRDGQGCHPLELLCYSRYRSNSSSSRRLVLCWWQGRHRMQQQQQEA